MIRWLKQPGNLAGVVLGLAPLVYLLRYVAEHYTAFPRLDWATRSLPVAIATSEGRLTWDMLFTPYSGHLTPLSHLLTAAVTLTTRWNLAVETVVILTIAVGTFAALMALAWQAEPRALPLVVFPAALVYFSVQQNANWLLGYNGVWFMTQALTLAAVLVVRRDGRWALPVVLMLAVCATFSHGQGFLVWPLLVLSLVLRPTRRPWPYFAVIGLGAVAVFAYLNTAGVVVGETESTAAPSVMLGSPLAAGRFALAMIGNMFSSEHVGGAVWVGTWVLALTVLNLAVIALGDRDWRFFRLWLPVAGYSVLTMLLIGASRGGAIGETAALNAWYITPTGFFWVGLIVSGVIVIVRARGGFVWWRYGAALANLVVAAGLAVLYVPGNVASLAREIEQFRSFEERCYLRFLYIQDSVAVNNEPDCKLWDIGQFNELAYFELALFADFPADNLLGATYDVGDPVVVMGERGWENWQIGRWLLDGVPDDYQHHITPTLPESIYGGQPTLPNYVTDTDALTATLAETDAFWTVQRAGTAPLGRSPFVALTDHLPTRFTYTTRQDVAFTVTRYQRLDLVTDDPVTFGDQFRLVGYSPLEGRLDACGTVTVRSFWETDRDDLIDGYSATMTLDRITGLGVWDYETVARADSQLSLTPTGSWQPGESYLDERRLEVPCELLPGDYALRLGVYDYRDGVRLIPARDGEASPAAVDLAEIETITVGE